MSEGPKEVTMRYVECPALHALSALADQLGFAVALAGGAARDAFHNHKATDHDLCVWNANTAHILDIRHALEELGYEETAYHETDPEYCEEERDCSDGRYVCVIEYSHPTLPDVDVLVFASGYQTLQDVLDSFDFNLNQFAITYDGVAQCQKGYYGGDQLYVLKQLHTAHVTYDRLVKMQGKANDYGWKYEEEYRACQIPMPPPFPAQ